MSAVGARPDDLDHYADALVEPMITVMSAGHELAAMLDDLSSRRYHGLERVPGVVPVRDCLLLIDALGDFDRWCRDTAESFREADRSCVIPPSMGSSAWAVFRSELTGVAWAAPWVTDRPVETDIVVVRAEAAAAMAGAVEVGFRIDRFADGTVEVTELGELGLGTELGAGGEIELSFGGSSVGMTLGATAQALVTTSTGVRWRVAAGDVATLIAHRVVEISGLQGAIRGAAELLTLIPESIGAFGFSIDIPGASALVAAGTAALVMLDYEPPEPVESATGVGVEAEASVELDYVVDIAALEASFDATYERVDYLGGWTADRVRLTLGGDLDLPFLDHDGSVGLTIERRTTPGGAPHSLAVTWTRTIDGRLVTEETLYDLTHPTAGRLGREAWAGLLDPTRLGQAFAVAAGVGEIPGVVRRTTEYAATERTYGLDFDVALLADVGVTLEVEAVALDRIAS